MFQYRDPAASLAALAGLHKLKIGEAVLTCTRTTGGNEGRAGQQAFGPSVLSEEEGEVASDMDMSD